ncbi:MAG: Cna B-type domain-containing protein [Eubacteriales bacterium]|nr:Cna B-type domain-containing protein [Eubacteriales bacterium]
MKKIMSLALVLAMLLNVALPTVNVFAEEGAQTTGTEASATNETTPDTSGSTEAGETNGANDATATTQEGAAQEGATSTETGEGAEVTGDTTAVPGEGLTDEEMLEGALTADAPKDITAFVDRSKPDVYQVDDQNNKIWLIRDGQVIKYKGGKESTEADAKLHVVEPNRKIEFKYTWHITEENMKNVKVGDFFTLQLPKDEFLGAFSFDFNKPIKIDSEENYPDGLGSFTISKDGKLTATLNQNINGKLLIKNGEFLVRYAVLADKKVTVDVDVPHDASVESVAIHGEIVPPSNSTLGNNEYHSLGVVYKEGNYIAVKHSVTKEITFRGMKWQIRTGHDQYKALLEALANDVDPLSLVGKDAHGKDKILTPRKDVFVYDDISDPNMVIDRDKPFEIRPYAYLMTKEGKLSTYAFSTPFRQIKKEKFKEPNPGESYDDFKSRMKAELKPLEKVGIYPAKDGKGERIIINYGDLDITNPKNYFSEYVSNMSLLASLDGMIEKNQITQQQYDYNIKAYKLQKTLEYKKKLKQDLAAGTITQEQYNKALEGKIPNDEEGNRSIPNLYYATIFFTKSLVPKGDYVNLSRAEWNTTEQATSKPWKIVYQEAVGKAGLEDLTSFSIKKAWQGRVAVDEITVVLTGDDTENGKQPSKYEVTLKKDEGWISVISRVRKNKEVVENGVKKVVPITYTASEKNALPNYDVEVKKNHESVDFTLINKNTEKIRLTINKKWFGDKLPEGHDGSVMVNVYDKRDTGYQYPLVENQKVLYDAANNVGTLSVELPKYHMGDIYDADVPVEYVVVEAKDNKYSANPKVEKSGDTENPVITLTNSPNIKIVIKKLWESVPGKANPTATIEIKNGNKVEKTFTTNEDKEETFLLPMFDQDGNKLVYTVEEKELAGYSSNKEENITAEVQKYTFTNRELHNLKITKKWNNGTEAIADKTVKLTLFYKNSYSGAFNKEYIDVDTKITAVYTNASGEQAAPLDNTDGKVKFTLPGDSVDGVLLIKGLPYVDKDGNTLFYSVREDEVEGFLPCIICDDNKHQVKTLYNLASKTLTLKKDWVMSDQTKKVDVEFILTNNGAAFTHDLAQVIKKANPSVVIDAGKIKVTVPAATGEEKLTLPAYDLANNPINYKVEEKQLDGFYAPRVEYNLEDNVITVKNISNETKSIKVKKVWRHPAGTAEKNVTIAVRPAQSPEKAVMLPKTGVTGDAKWEHEFTGLPKYDSTTGAEIVYSVEETGKPANYNVTRGTEGDKLLVINTIEGKVSISVTKKWLGAIKADSVTVGVFQNGADTPLKQAVLRAKATDANPNIWTDNTTFVDLPQYDGSGLPYTYTIKELKIGDVPVVNNETADYKVTLNGTEITNYNKEKVEVPFTKTWVGKPAAQVVIHLKADGVKTQEITLTAADVVEATQNDEFEGKVSWAGKFTGLPKYSEADGHVIAYTVEEVPVLGYTLKQEGNEFINTNTEKIEVSVEKRWVNSSVERVQIDLLADGKRVDGVTLSGPWKHTFTGLLKYDQTTGKEIVYTVTEKEVPNFKTDITGDMVNGFIVTNTYLPPLDPYNPGGETPEPTPEKPNPTPPTDNIPNEPTPEGEPNKPTPPVPPVPSIPEEEVPNDPIPEGKTELPKTDGVPAGAMHILGLAMAAIGLLIKKKK